MKIFLSHFNFPVHAVWVLGGSQQHSGWATVTLHLTLWVALVYPLLDITYLCFRLSTLFLTMTSEEHSRKYFSNNSLPNNPIQGCDWQKVKWYTYWLHFILYYIWLHHTTIAKLQILLKIVLTITYLLDIVPCVTENLKVSMYYVCKNWYQFS